MRILHTSDWHLGRSIQRVSLLDDQAKAIDRIVEITKDSQVDVVIIAGDIYDRSIPPAEAVELFDESIARLAGIPVKVVAITGNHDSAIRVSVYDKVLTSAGCTMRGEIARLSEPVVASGEGDGFDVAIYPVPYLDPVFAATALYGNEGTDPEDDTGADAHAADSPARGRPSHDETARRALELIKHDLGQRRGARSIVVAHTFVSGGTTTESERELTVGNVEKVGADAFAGFDYVALGHLHRSQDIDGPRIAYSGTPLQYSFSEENQTKEVRVVELDGGGVINSESVALNVGRRLKTIQGTLEELLSSREFSKFEDARIRAILTDNHLPGQAMSKLQARFPHALDIEHAPTASATAATPVTTKAIAAASPGELVNQFWLDQTGNKPNSAERRVLDAAIDQALKGHEA